MLRAAAGMKAYAKINWALRVTGKRADGFHDIETLFQTISLHDTLTFERADAISLTCDDPSIPVDDTNLVVRAAKAIGVSARMHLEKKIPAGGGLGGGSSDAASCLLALNRLWKLNLPVAALARIGLSLGADVPFFLGGRNAWVEGIGESLTPVNLPAARFAVVKPPQGLPTAAIFSHPRLTRDTGPAIISGFAANPLPQVFEFGRNDLQGVAQELCPGVTQALDWLGSQGLKGRMTGSGSAVFAHLPAGQPLREAPAGWMVRECGNLVAHPLAGWAPSDDISVGG